jgi:cell division transport system permease protein
VTPIAKETAWAKLVQEMGLSDIQGATAQLNGNPLVDQLNVKASDSKEVPLLATQLKEIQGVDQVQYVDEAVQHLAQLNQGLNWVGLFITTLLSLTAIAVINTTIRLIVLARRQEIEVMQLVGATRTWIYFPFILQGLLLSMFGALIAWALICGIQQFMGNLLLRQPDFIRFLTEGVEVTPQETLILPLALLGLGGAVGLLGSLFAVRRFATRRG